MKTTLLSLMLCLSYSLHAKPLVLVSYFDPFDKAKSNNSETIAKALEGQLNLVNQVDIKICRLESKYEKAYGQLEECYKSLESTPDLVLGLGESTCDLRLETIMTNNDKSFGPDNGGIERDNTSIISEAPLHLGLSYPLAKMYCSLSTKEQRGVKISNDAGSFVCNNMAFQMSYYYPQVAFGFLHVPAHNCFRLMKKNIDTVAKIEKMIVAAVEDLKVNQSESRLPISAVELEILKSQFPKGESCLGDFYHEAKAK